MINKNDIKKDLYQAVNGEWIKNAVIPADKPTTGGFQDLVIKTEEDLINDFNTLEKTDNEEMNEFLIYYNMTKDFETRNKIGVEPLRKYVNKIENIKTFEDFEKLSIEWINKGLPLPFDFDIYSDMSNAELNVLYLEIASIILPDKTYYGTEQGNKLLEVYSNMLNELLTIYGYEKDKIEQIISNTLAFDNVMQVYTKTSVELADYTKLNNPRTLEEVENYTKEFSFSNIIKNIINASPEKVIVTQPIFFENYNRIITQDNFELLKSWLISKIIIASKDYLTDEIRNIAGKYRRYITGVEKEMDIEKYSYYLATAMYSEVISVYYGEKYFGKEAKKDVEDMVKSMIKVYENRLEKNTWLNETTRKSAIKKLKTLGILIGYPEKYDEVFKQLKVNKAETFFENSMKFKEVITKHKFLKWNTEYKKLEWGMSSNTVNAYYNPQANHICFPAAILQKPFYSIKQTRSENFGGIGAVIGHEISHAFDNNGSQFDENGNMNNWWTEEDYKIFDEKAKDMIAQFDGIKFGDGVVDGTLTVSENIADAGGLSCALESLKNTEVYNLEEFFINWAKVWCRKAKAEYVNLLLKTDVHAPGELRANIQVKNLKEFYETFDVKEDDEMYLAEDKRVSIW